MRPVSLYVRFYNLNVHDIVIRNKLFKIYKLYCSDRKLWTEKNYNKLHKILNQYERRN